MWLLENHNAEEVFKIEIDKITPEQLTVDKVKFDRVSSWIERPKDIVVTCIKIDDRVVTIDGYSRLVSPEEHQRIWIDRCQAYFRSEREENV